MITQPTPTNPTTRRGRAARLLGIALPMVLLVAVVGGGVLGRSHEPPSPEPTAAVVSGVPGPAASPDPSASTPADGVAPALALDTTLPTVAGDLAVWTVTEAQAARTTTPADRVVAVSGYLGIPNPPTDCGDPVLGPLGPLCERNAILTEQPWAPSSDASFATTGPHLHPRFPVGVGLPDELTGPDAATVGPPAVIVLGRFESRQGNCAPTGGGCDEGFVADRVIWVDGTWLPSTPMVGPGVDGLPREWMLHNQPIAEVAALGWSGTILVEALLRPETVASVDAAAGSALAARPSPAGLVWYVRGLETGYDATRYPLGQSPPRLTWMILDDVTGAVIARRPQPAPSFGP
jgi:hypothetical protein